MVAFLLVLKNMSKVRRSGCLSLSQICLGEIDRAFKSRLLSHLNELCTEHRSGGLVAAVCVASKWCTAA